MSPKIALILGTICVFSSCLVTFGDVLESLLEADEPYFEDKFALDDVPMSSFTLKSRYEDEDEDYGGPSSEFRPLGHNWEGEINRQYFYKRGVDTDCLERKRGVANDEITAKELCAKEKDFFAKTPAVMKKIEKALEETLKKGHLQGVITGRIKGLNSLVGKMNKDGITDVREITDIVGLRVTLQTTTDIKRFRRAFQRLFNRNVTEIRCYGTCGPDVGHEDKRLKIYWPWRGSGYRRLHFKIAVPSLGTEAEIQIGTPYMTLWAEWSHGVVYKGPEKLKKEKDVLSYSQELAEYYTMLDNIRAGMLPRCPEILHKTPGQDIFAAHDWEVFGKPPNGCNYWNDLRVDMP